MKFNAHAMIKRFHEAFTTPLQFAVFKLAVFTAGMLVGLYAFRTLDNWKGILVLIFAISMAFVIKWQFGYGARK